MRELRVLAVLGGAVLLLSLRAQSGDADDARAVLAESCYPCHGEKVQSGGLRLDTQAAAMRAITAGDAAGSLIVKRITGAGGLPRMPMGGAALSPEKIDRIRKWIDSGAAWPESTAQASKKHWAFIPPQRPAVPRPGHPIDAFVQARLEREGLKPSPPADRATLLRRLSLDLIGLPPTPQELDAFLADPSANAYEKQVDRLLASPHYGERWGRIWLDGARYADSNGYEKDAPRIVWSYRDWVINALNRDLPYDRFVVEQIAGDLLPNATQDQRVATGFLRNSMINEEGGVDPEQFRMEAMFDRMDAIGKGILGVTIQCAQCHDHKYDPIKQEEYYRIFAFLNDTHESNIAVYTPGEQARRSDVLRRVKEIETGLRRAPDWQSRMAAWEAQVRDNQPDWRVLRLTVDDISTGGERELPMPDGSMLALGYAPTKHTVKFTAKPELPATTAVRLELLIDPNLPAGGPGRSIRGSGALTEFALEAAIGEAATGAPDQFEKLKIAGATADLNMPETTLEPKFDDKSGKRRVTGPIEYAIDGKDETAWTLDAGPGLRNQARKAVFVLEKPVTAATLNIYLKMNHGGANSDDNENNNLGRIRLSVTSAPSPTADPVPQSVRDLFAVPPAQRTPQQVDAIFTYWRTTVPEWREQNDRIAALLREYPEGSLQLVLADRTGEHRETHILKRGDFLQPGRVVTRGTPVFLNPLSPGKPDRLTFARWLVDRGAPTTARSIVNRVWQAYFGTGIVATAENLGTQSEPPVNQDLLDWMSVEFMDSGWSLKKLHRTIVTSAAYRQSSVASPELLAKDPDNRLLARGARIRVDAETVRDIALAASGLLNPTIGGPSVFPPAPAFLFLPPASYSPKSWKPSEGADRYRRGIYTFRFRSVPFPMLQAFDAPNGEMSCVRRTRSNTPLQALTTLNEPLFVESAQAFARRILKEGGSTDRERLNYAFRLATARTPSPAEAGILLDLMAKEEKRIADGWASAQEIAGKASTGEIAPTRVAAWTVVARVVLNLDETITKD